MKLRRCHSVLHDSRLWKNCYFGEGAHRVICHADTSEQSYETKKQKQKSNVYWLSSYVPFRGLRIRLHAPLNMSPNTCTQKQRIQKTRVSKPAFSLKEADGFNQKVWSMTQLPKMKKTVPSLSPLGNTERKGHDETVMQFRATQLVLLIKHFQNQHS